MVYTVYLTVNVNLCYFIQIIVFNNNFILSERDFANSLKLKIFGRVDKLI